MRENFFKNNKEISMKYWIMFPQIKFFWKFKKKSDENSIRTSEHSAISKRFWVDSKEFPENCSRNFTLILGKFQGILKN